VTSPAGSDDLATRSWWSTWYPATLVAVVVVAGLLVWAGSNAILANTEGNLIRTVDDPTQPGFEALVEPTPVMAVIVVDDNDALGSAVVLSLTGDRVAGMVFVPPATVIPGPDRNADADGDADSVAESEVLADRWSSDGMDGVTSGVEQILNVGIVEARVVDSGQWAALIAPVGDLVVTSPDTVSAVVGDEDAGSESSTVTFEAGEIVISPDQVGPFLAATNSAESDLNRMVRQQQLWVAWLEAVGADLNRPGVVPGESDTGLGRFVRAMAASQIELVTLPVRTVTEPSSGEALFVPATQQVDAMVARLIPFPVGAAPGSRLRVRILDGTGMLNNGLPAAPSLVEAGAEVATVGNATNFDYSTTQFIVAESGDLAWAERLRDSLGVGEVVSSAEQASAVDVTVVLGRDALESLNGRGMGVGGSDDEESDGG
jgi:hypothetical protein